MKVSATTTLGLSLLLLLWAPGEAMEYSNVCPPQSEVSSDPCQSACSTDTDCHTDTRNDTLCCPSSTCGYQCATPMTIPFYSPALVCHETSGDMAGACIEACNDCAVDELCCSNGCGHMCMVGVEVTPICQGIIASFNGTYAIGAYVPQCSEDGNFNATQCHGSTGYCWCVRPETGVPLTTGVMRFQRPQCTCVHKGQVHYVGDTFSDDCNTCWCSEGGAVSCTEIGCHPPEEPSSPYYSCPVLEDGMAGICSEECGSDDDCNSDQKCCSNGCGHTCMDPVSIPYMAPPRECPEEDEGPVLCDGQECTTDSCDNSQLCCENSCGSRLCVDGVLPPYPCTRTIDGMSGGDMLGSFIPRCREEDGSFLALQCFSHYCWCVDTASGEPTSDMVESGSVGALECSGCEYDGKMYHHEDVVERHGGCGKSTCLGGEIVTAQACDQCEWDGRTYEHGEKTDRCGLCVCLDGGVACAQSAGGASCPTQCVHRGIYHLPGDTFPEGDGCNSCVCSDDLEVTCTEVACEEETDDSPVELAWWHSVLIGAGILITVLAVIAMGLLLFMVLLIRNSQFRHRKLQETSDTLSFEHEAPVLYKNGPPEAESVELKVPVADDSDPVKT